MPSSIPVHSSQSDLAWTSSTPGQLLVSTGPTTPPVATDTIPTSKAIQASLAVTSNSTAGSFFGSRYYHQATAHNYLQYDGAGDGSLLFRDDTRGAVVYTIGADGLMTFADNVIVGGTQIRMTGASATVHLNYPLGTAYIQYASNVIGFRTPDQIRFAANGCSFQNLAQSVNYLIVNAVGTSQIGQSEFRAPSSTTPDQAQAKIIPSWSDSTHATRKGRLSLQVSDFNGDKEGLQINTDGTRAYISTGDLVVNPVNYFIVNGPGNSSYVMRPSQTPLLEFRSGTGGAGGGMMYYNGSATLVASEGMDLGSGFHIDTVGNYPVFFRPNGTMALNLTWTAANFSVPPVFPTVADASIPNGGMAWSSTTPGALKARDPSGTLKTANLT